MLHTSSVQPALSRGPVLPSQPLGDRTLPSIAFVPQACSLTLEHWTIVFTARNCVLLSMSWRGEWPPPHFPVENGLRVVFTDPVRVTSVDKTHIWCFLPENMPEVPLAPVLCVDFGLAHPQGTETGKWVSRGFTRPAPGHESKVINQLGKPAL